MSDLPARRFTYEFQVWPDETGGFDPAVYELFKVMRSRVAMEFTEKEFARFRVELMRGGLTLREIERTPYFEPEHIH